MLPRSPGRPPRSPAWRNDAALAVGLTAAALVEASLVPVGNRLAALSVVALLPVALAWRRARPALVVAAVAAAFAAQLAWPAARTFDRTFTCYVVLLLAAYSVGRFGRRTVRWAAAGASAVVLGLVIGVHDGSVVSGLVAAVLVLAAAGIGRTVAVRTELRELLEAQAAELAEAALTAEEAAAAEVRAHLAGEVQDVVHRHVQRMLTGARGAQAVVRDPGPAAGLVEGVEADGREALDEMRRMLGLLRRGDEPASLLPTDASVAVAVPGRPVGVRAPVTRPRLPRAVSDFLALAVVAVAAGESAWSVAVAGAARPTVVAACLGGALIAAPLLVRRAYPLAASVAGWAAACAVVAFVPLPVLALTLTAPLLAYTVGAHAARWRALAGLGVGWAGIVAVNLVVGGAGWGDYVVPVALVGLAWLAGQAVAEQTAISARVKEQNRELERLRDLRAAAASAEERLRIARELHDVLAHTLMVMVVQAGAARRTLDTDPGRARSALAVVVETGEGALAELGRLLSVVDPSAVPAGSGLGGLSALVARARASGLTVELRAEDSFGAVPAGLDLAAYRIIQEALTNVIRHAGATRAEVTVVVSPGRLSVRVTDDGRSGSRPRAGHGIAGMRERVRLYGGEFSAGPSSSGFVVSASFPLSAVPAGQPA